jgi:hypothetical protein
VALLPVDAVLAAQAVLLPADVAPAARAAAIGTRQ